MNGMNDVGGMDGFGPVEIEKNEPVFHHQWEAKSFALGSALGGWRKWNLDQIRYFGEKMNPRDYLNHSYFDRGIMGLTERGIVFGLFTKEEVKTGHPAPGSPKLTPPITADMIAALLKTPHPTLRSVDSQPLFKVGDRVRTATDSPPGHTRLVRYIRGRAGEIILYHGAHVFPDAHAEMSAKEDPRHLYTVRFIARELWGQEGGAHDTMTVDVWEPYLRKA
jgi:nitrile hydratase